MFRDVLRDGGRASTVPGLFVKRNDIMNLPVPVPVATIVLLILSNVFMTFAWYGHLRYKALPAARRHRDQLGHSVF